MKIDYLVYTSEISHAFQYEDISSIINTSCERNPEHEITGALAFFDDIYMQYIEGPRQNLNRLYNNILHDGRHTNVTLRVYGTSSVRLAKSWSMLQIEDSITPYLPRQWNDNIEEYLDSLSSEEIVDLVKKLLEKY